MNKKYYKLIRQNKVIVAALIVIITLSICNIFKTVNSQKNVIKAGTKEVINKKINNISVSYNITFGDEIKDVTPDIINAAIQGMFDYYCNEHNIAINNRNTYVLIMSVKKMMVDQWEVHFVIKEKESDTYPTFGYSKVTVEKQKAGGYKGFIINSGGPIKNIR